MSTQKRNPNTPASIKVSIAIPAYNEAKNIEALLKKTLNQSTKTVRITEIIVIASGCTDQTVEIVKKFIGGDRAAAARAARRSLERRRTPNSKQTPVKLITQNKREGKASAINAFLEIAKADICVIMGADTLPETNTIEKLCSVFSDPHIGMAGGHTIPKNTTKTFIGYCVNMLWQLHHEMALISPKCGEIIAFRKIFSSIPAETPVDEASIEQKIIAENLKLKYVEDATIYNRGPTTLKDFIAQRRRINAGHLWLKKHFSHKVSTTSYLTILKLSSKKLGFNLKENLYLAGLILIELTSKILAYFDYYILEKNYTIWPQIKSSKNL